MGGRGSRLTDISQRSTINNNIYRLAIDPFALIGSPYDAKKDRFLPIAPINIPQMSVTPQEAASGPTIDGGRLKDRNPPDIIGIDKELYLSVCLKITASAGVPLLMNYPFMINEYTRFLSYYYPTHQSCVTQETPITRLKDVQKLLHNTDGTHVVTRIQYGIHVVIILQLPPKYVSNLDQLLEKIQRYLTANTFRIESNEEQLFSQLKNINVFSNIPEIAKLTKLTDICQQITYLKSDLSQHRPIEYTLRPIRWFCSRYPIDKAKYIPLNNRQMTEIQSYVNELMILRKQFIEPVDSTMKRSIDDYFKEQYEDVQQRKSRLELLYQRRLDRLHVLVLGIRRGDVNQDTLVRPLIDTEDTILLQESRDAVQQLDVHMEKAQQIDDFKQQGIVYWNVNEIITNDDKTWDKIEEKLMKKGNGKCIFCFSDKLKKASLAQWNETTNQLMAEYELNELAYADFSLCSYPLSKMKILSSKRTRGQRRSSWGELNPDDTTLSSSKQWGEESNPLSNSNVINVLLLGESGVGKSTFINAIINYLTFDTFEKAHTGRPIVVIPVSFLLTTGDQFEEQTVTFGDPDPSENHQQHQGHSVTQHCRSYVFSISTQTKIRFIDTPGMGDTRGLDQDDQNMQQILTFINNLPHLNAICILLKPNESKLNVVLRSYFTRLIGFLGENVRNNIIFCFTNTRATFFAPGDTGPLLRRMLESQTTKNIPFTDINTFCFDNEAFRYLLARRNNIEFTDNEAEEYKQSWVTSTTESTRFVDYISKTLRSYVHKDWQSIDHAQFEISQMIRPMLETIRNTMRSIILVENSSSKGMIRLRPTATPKNSTICQKCKPSIVLLGDFWVIPDEPHVFADQCDKCTCDLSRHSNVNYLLKYESWNDRRKPSINEMKTNLDRLRQMLFGFIEFFKYVGRIAKENDPILAVLNRTLEQERYICSQKQQNELNSYLYNNLKALKKDYEQTWMTLIPDGRHITLPEIYKQIRNIRKDNMILEQMNAIKKTQETSMKEQEKYVS